MIASSERRFLDSNVWLYALTPPGTMKAKKDSAMELIRQGGVLTSLQVINEVCVNLKLKIANPFNHAN